MLLHSPKIGRVSGFVCLCRSLGGFCAAVYRLDGLDTLIDGFRLYYSLL